jgi:hypothetical protein
MKNLITNALGIMVICASAAYSQGQPKRDSTVKNQNNVVDPTRNNRKKSVETQNSNTTKNQNSETNPVGNGNKKPLRTESSNATKNQNSEVQDGRGAISDKQPARSRREAGSKKDSTVMKKSDL